MENAAALLGTWRMVLWTRTVIATGVTTDAMGPNPNGYIAYQADGRMMALVVDRRRRERNSTFATDADKASLFELDASLCGVLSDRRRQGHTHRRRRLAPSLGR